MTGSEGIIGVADRQNMSLKYLANLLEERDSQTEIQKELNIATMMAEQSRDARQKGVSSPIVRMVDDSSGDPYWYNTESGERTWFNPNDIHTYRIANETLQTNVHLDDVPKQTNEETSIGGKLRKSRRRRIRGGYKAKTHRKGGNNAPGRVRTRRRHREHIVEKRQRGGAGKLIDIPKTSDDLKVLIDTYGIDSSNWGVSGTKSVENLLKELESGESSLVDEDGKLLRMTSSVWARIQTPSISRHVLVEVLHRNPEGESTKVRRHPGADYTDSVKTALSGWALPNYPGHPMSEKIKVGESPADAIRRGIKEELGVMLSSQGRPVDLGLTDKAIQIGDVSAPQRVSMNSKSYPGLHALYIIYHISVEVSGLPDTVEFKTIEYGYDGSIKRIIDWKWMKVSQ